MSRLILPIWIVLMVLAGMIAKGQIYKRPHMLPPPPAPADARLPDSQSPTKPETVQKKGFDAVQPEREARELSDLAESIRLDVDHVNQGLMPKDTVEKLTRIEKLSKHPRTELATQ